MTINNLPAAIADAIQSGMLERRFEDALTARLGFRELADREPFLANIGETITKTRTGLLAPVTAPMAPASNTDITSGLTAAQYGIEQYVLAVGQYANPMLLNVATSRVAIANLFLRNAYTLGENARRSVDTLARNALFDMYMGGNTRVTTTLGSAGTVVHVDDVRGFFQTLNSGGQVVPVSSSNPVNVQVGSDVYSMTAAVADGTAPASLPPWLSNLTFSGSSSNSSTAPNGFSGNLTFATNVTVADGTALNAVVSAVAPSVIRPSTSSANVMAATTAAISSSSDINNGRVTIQMVLAAKAQLEANNVPHLPSGMYRCLIDPIQITGLYADPAFQQFFRGQIQSEEYKRGLIAELLGVEIVETNQAFVQTNLASTVGGAVRRAIVSGQGSIVEGVFTREGYDAANDVDDGNLTTVVDDIAHITREPIDALKQVVTQSWSYIGGFVAPTDTTANPTVLPTATNAAYKRACIIESL